MKNINIVVVFTTFIMIACGGGDDGGDGPDPQQQPPVTVPEPKATTLIFPENNTECNEGAVLNDNESSVIFEWNASENTDSYELNVVDLNTSTIQKSSATNTSQTITLERGVPYEWFVVSSGNGTKTIATSPKWKFYNQGKGVENYAPFPAEAVSPARGATINYTSNVALRWLGSDIDNDIDSFEVFFGTETDPATSLGTTTDTMMEATVVSGQVYYWKVVAKDSQGNTSESEIFEFRMG